MLKETDIIILRNEIYGFEVNYCERDRNMLVVQKDFKYGEIFIPKGFRFDGASIPYPLWGIFGKPNEKYYLLPSCIHDYVYNTKNCPINRKKADDMFYELLIKEGNSTVKSFLMWSAVRVFGRLYWRSNK